MQIENLQKEIHENAKSKGFYDNPVQNIGEKLMLTTSELSEALEADRQNRYADMEAFRKRLEELNSSINTYVVKPENVTNLKQEFFVACFKKYIKDTFEDELADAVIRLLDIAEYKGVNLYLHIKLKMEFNKTRERLHGKKY